MEVIGRVYKNETNVIIRQDGADTYAGMVIREGNYFKALVDYYGEIDNHGKPFVSKSEAAYAVVKKYKQQNM